MDLFTRTTSTRSHSSVHEHTCQICPSSLRCFVAENWRYTSSTLWRIQRQSAHLNGAYSLLLPRLPPYGSSWEPSSDEDAGHQRAARTAALAERWSCGTGFPMMYSLHCVTTRSPTFDLYRLQDLRQQMSIDTVRRLL